MKLYKTIALGITLPFVVFCYLVTPQALAQSSDGSCVCDCVYSRTDKIRNHRYYSPGPDGSCKAIEGKACVGTHRGENFRGYIAQCDAGPSQVGSPMSSWLSVKQVKARQDPSPAIYSPNLSYFLPPN